MSENKIIRSSELLAPQFDRAVGGLHKGNHDQLIVQFKRFGDVVEVIELGSKSGGPVRPVLKVTTYRDVSKVMELVYGDVEGPESRRVEFVDDIPQGVSCPPSQFV